MYIRILYYIIFCYILLYCIILFGFISRWNFLSQHVYLRCMHWSREQSSNIFSSRWNFACDYIHMYMELQILSQSPGQISDVLELKYNVCKSWYWYKIFVFFYMPMTFLYRFFLFCCHPCMTLGILSLSATTSKVTVGSD